MGSPGILRRRRHSLTGLVVVVALVIVASFLIPSATPLGFPCTSPAGTSCHALVGYVLPNDTSLSSVQSLFGVKHLRTLLGANGLPLSTPPNHTLPLNSTVRVPFPCSCSNGTGTSVGIPVYVVRKDDGLYHIAADVFSSLVTYPDIQDFNGIANPDLIYIGQRLRIPLPCSCDEVDGVRVVHYGHRVAEGSTVGEIADEFGVSQDLLMRLNNISTVNDLIADFILDVPLKACTSSISNNSLDASLLVANGTYVFTANNCVKCSCGSADNWTLQCEPSGITLAGSSTCPSLKCSGSNLYIGNSSTIPCQRTSCDYGGYTNQSIIANLTTVSTCPAPTPNHASRISPEAPLIDWNLVVALSVTMLITLPSQLLLP
ncbi:hypothetical protein MLD38_032269 [Melastoma candidum]|uniref:Uncharacterized protein n=1 Tax=Melastoma candidum TaxID=119954 RepID=A0ACB9M547_9MYRT|nr:hypothetical protein MLD38_032269 [Melastoma candidum]